VTTYFKISLITAHQWQSREKLKAELQQWCANRRFDYPKPE